MKLIVFETVLLGVLLRLLPVMSLICPVNNEPTPLPPLTRIADVICEGSIKKAPSNAKVGNSNVNFYGTGQDNITITVRRVLKGKKKVTTRSELLVNVPKSNQQYNCIYSLRKGDKRLFFLITYKDTYYTMLTPPIDSTKIQNRKLRRIISNSGKCYALMMGRVAIYPLQTDKENKALLLEFYINIVSVSVERTSQNINLLGTVPCSCYSCFVLLF